ncbi:hypothetical protein BJV77DRAFT_1041325 [Russula vinacea]|nr:hypothetical protein BJV77DRAFT_1041325 [Russula vinacea]
MRIVSGATYLLVVEAWVEAETIIYPVNYWGPQPMRPTPHGTVCTSPKFAPKLSTVTSGPASERMISLSRDRMTADHRPWH